MAAAARKPVSINKRKTAPTATGQPEPAKKKSPLYNQPQNFYAPSAISSMTKDELSEWRKEQRRKRNRESAAASRNKTRAKIDELEGEVVKWKTLYHDMEAKMRCMERHVQFLTKLNSTSQEGGHLRVVTGLAPPPTVVSHPNSPPMSPSPFVAPPIALPVPNAVASFVAPFPAFPSQNATHPFPTLLSEPQDCAQVEKREAAADVVTSNEESRKHLISIPRQA